MNGKSDTLLRRVRVLIVDDHPSVLAALEHAISRGMGMECCGQASSSESALALARTTRPDVAIVDMRLHDKDGLALVRDLKTLFPDLKVILFTMFEGAAYEAMAREAGASAYLSKRASTSDVIATIVKSVTRTPPSVARRSTADLSRLSAGERKVLDALSVGSTIAGIARQLGLSSKTIATYLPRMADKLSLADTGALRLFAAELGMAREFSNERHQRPALPQDGQGSR